MMMIQDLVSRTGCQLREGEMFNLDNLWKLMQVSLKQVAFTGYLDTFRGRRIIIKTSGRRFLETSAMCDKLITRAIIKQIT